MRLLNTSSLEFKHFFEPPPYVILSHRWTDEEVSYEEYCLVQDDKIEQAAPWLSSRVSGIKSKTGYKKIVDFCAFALSWDTSWAWIDTCCIDKRSSAELSEAINSMWKWYQLASFCVVYVSAVEPLTAGTDAQEQFAQSEWFRRGWTLQELLAPYRLTFCNKTWEIFGHLERYRQVYNDQNLVAAISAATKIPPECLVSNVALGQQSIAQKMSWAAHRRTTRVEDMAYCLLGLFGVNMPLLYGEGSKAFVRLQKEIIQQTGDESIFAWCNTHPTPCTTTSHFFHDACVGILASSPAYFADCGNIVDITLHQRRPWTVTNKGLELDAEAYVLCTESVRPYNRICVIPLNCSVSTASGPSPVACAIALKCPPASMLDEDHLTTTGRVYACTLDPDGHCREVGMELQSRKSLQRTKFYIPLSK